MQPRILCITLFDFDQSLEVGYHLCSESSISLTDLYKIKAVGFVWNYSRNLDETRPLITDISWAPLGLFSIIELIIYGLLKSCCVSCVLMQPHVSKQ